ncbi:P-loop containing nucleoside triphosphate hydrolase protein [Daedaleopsis nitida]|nr:P-loop containing nucleoside triphosphate hydrolase protein [Daedaleopsis nitida]
MAQKTALAKGQFQKVSDLLLKKPCEAAKKCKLTLKEMDHIMSSICKELEKPPTLLRDVADVGEEQFTTGDPAIDDVLGGGIRTGMIWEISGENNAGKTQLALQLSLSVQLDQARGGVSGSACYITTRDGLPTKRLDDMIRHHPALSPVLRNLSDVETVHAFNHGAFNRVLTETVPQTIARRATSVSLKPVKLIVVDTFSDIFDSNKDSQFEDLAFRARCIRKASLLLHQLASNHRIAVILLGSTRKTHPRIDGQDRAPGELRYSDQARWFARGYSYQGEDDNEAILGHVWPNQLNARIMMSRTMRTRPRSDVDPGYRVGDGDRANKRRRLDSDKLPGSSQSSGDDRIPFRRFSVIFSSVAPPASCDYVVLEQGVVAFSIEESPPATFMYATPIPPPTSASPSSISSQTQSYPSVATPTPTPTQANTNRATSRTTAGSSSRSPFSRQSLSYATVSPSPRPTPPHTLPSATTTTTTTVSTTATDDDEDAMLWELTQEQSELFDSLPDAVLGERFETGVEADVEAEAEEGPPVTEEDHHSSDSELWKNFDSDFD